MSDTAEIAALKVKVEHLEEQIAEMSADLKAVRDVLAEIRGGKKVLWSLWSALGVLAGIVATYFTVRG